MSVSQEFAASFAELRESLSTPNVDTGELLACIGDAIEYRAEPPLHVTILGSTDGNGSCYRPGQGPTAGDPEKGDDEP